MVTTVHIGERTIVLKAEDFDSEINIDQITAIDYSNIYGEAVTVSALLNKIGMLKAEAEHYYNLRKMEVDIYDAELKRKFRRQANQEGGKFYIEDEPIKLTEKSLDEAVLLDKGYKAMKKECFEAKKDLDMLDSLFWAISAKNKKLDHICKAVTPEEFVNELVEGSVNTYTVIKNIK